MEGNPKTEISETNRGKKQKIIDRKFKYNFSKLKKDNTKIYREVLNYESEIGYIFPEYKTIKFQITRYKNKQLSPNIKTFDEVPNETEYYKTIRGEYFMILKYSNIIIFQSPFQAKLFMENKHIFADGTFLIAPTNSYQEVKDHNILNTYYKVISNLCFINIECIPDIFNKIKIICKRYESTYHITNNTSESYNKRVDEIKILVEYYKNMEAELNNIGCSKNDIIENWFNCLVRLNNKIINFNKTK
ncbi:hypothetical protein U3516DRAFT_762224 [Neocallimastix sp. 'constans']